MPITNEPISAMVPFETFWARLKAQLSQLPGTEPGTHVRTVRKWSQLQDYFGGEFALLYRGGNVITCETGTTNNVRTGISTAEFRKVYGAWREYRAGRVRRKFIAQDLGVQNASWIIPILREYEPLMQDAATSAEDDRHAARR